MNGSKSTGVAGLHRKTRPRPKPLSANVPTASETEFPFTRGARVGFLFLLLITALFASGAIFVKYQLEDYRTEFAREIESRIGAQLSVGTIAVNGLKGLRIDAPDMRFEVADGPTMRVTAPAAFIDINLNDLFQGSVTIERVSLDGARIVVDRPEGAVWYTEDGIDTADVLPEGLSRAFRVTGTDCSLVVNHVVGDTSLTVEDLRFDVSRLSGSPDIVAALDGDVSGDPAKHVSARVNFASLSDFDARVQTSLLTAEDVNVFLPASRQLVTSGSVHPYLRVSGLPDDMLLLVLESTFEGLVFRDPPEFIRPATGTLTAMATYATDLRLLSVTTAKAESTQIDGEVDGAISFIGDYPAFDLTLTASRMPLPDMLDYALSGEVERYGTLDMTLNEPHELVLTVAGTSEAPVVAGTMRAASGDLRFAPQEEGVPPVTLAMNDVQGSWRSDTEALAASFNVTDGEAVFTDWNVTASRLSGTVRIEDGYVTIDPLNASITENDWVGSLRYGTDTGDFEARVRGTLAGLEHTAFRDMIPRTALRGDVNVSGLVTRTGKRYEVDATVDASRTGIAYDWWFDKPPGIAVNGQGTIALVQDESAQIDTTFSMATSELEASLLIERRPERWATMAATATTSKLDFNSAGATIHLPYRITGGTADQGKYTWRRDRWNLEESVATVQLSGDALQLLPLAEGAEHPLVINGFSLDGRITRGIDPEGTLTVQAREAVVPRLGEPMLVSLDGYRPASEYVPRRWEYGLRVDDLTMPPWQGTAFHAEAYSNPDSMGFKSYGADIEAGRIGGHYHLIREDNVYSAAVQWTDVPARYILEHLRYPDVLTGIMSGEVDYAVDRDDPNTLRGDGMFDIRDGKFSADFLYSMLEDASDGAITLPPSLGFTQLRADVEFEKDMVRTPKLSLDADQLKLAGTGHYIRDGDMDYSIEVAVSPDLADDIPALQNLNIQGYRIANRDITLGFNIGGPTFNPQGKVAELPPARVTLISGALEATGEALKVLDAPRKILVDLLRMGGGIVGGRQTGGESRE